jgi:hypothetical protein
VRSVPRGLVRGLGGVIGSVHGGLRNLLTFITDLDGRPDLQFDAANMPALLGRAPTGMEDFVRSKVVNRATSI